MYSARKIEFAGKFVPVKWTCRALLGSGRLCPRMDRVKCPFHGLIIARKDDGSPANFADAEKLARIKAKQRQGMSSFVSLELDARVSLVSSLLLED